MCLGAHGRSLISTSSMRSSCSSAVPGQLHTTIPGPNGAHACLTLYDVCPHTFHSTNAPIRSREAYLHHDLPSPPAALPLRTIEYLDNRGSNIVETTRSTLQPIQEPRRTQVIEYTRHRRSRSSSSSNTSSPSLRVKEKAMSASLAPLVLSKHSPTMHHIRESTASPPPRSILKPSPSVPTIYLLSFSTDRTPTTRAFAALLNTHLPLRVPLQYTIDARSFLVPPRYICEAYSGVSGVVQDEVLSDGRARKEIDSAVDELTRFVRRGGRETGVAVCCTAGTHRSVAIAELIALGVRREVRRLGSAEGVKVVVRHVHRVKGPKDPY